MNMYGRFASFFFSQCLLTKHHETDRIGHLCCWNHRLDHGVSGLDKASRAYADENFEPVNLGFGGVWLNACWLKSVPRLRQFLG